MTDRHERLEAPAGVERVEARLDELTRRFRVGDLTAKAYARLRQDLLAHLGRCRIGPLLESGEPLVAEHHWVEPTSRLPDSALRETPLHSVSLYATDRRLFRWRFQDPGAHGTTARRDLEGRLDVRWYTQITAVRRHREVRWGEAATGLVIATAGTLLYQHLSVTAPFILAVGVFGMLHALLVPTRRAAIRTPATDETDWVVSAVGTRSGKALLAALRSHLPPSPDGT
jgi:hypothetical protein